jgi:hypothetical protein
MEKNYDEMNDEVTTISEEEFDDTVEEFEDDVVEESKVKAFARKAKKGVKKYGPTVLKVSGMAALTLFGYALGAKSGHKDDTEDDVVAESEYKEVDTESVESDSTTSEEN